MKLNIMLLLFLTTIFSGCTAIIYAIRGPKYEGKFKEERYLPMLEGQYFYIHHDRSEGFNDTIRIHGNDTTFITPN